MPRKPKPLTDPQRVKLQEYAKAVEHASKRRAEREADIRRIVNEQIHEDNMVAWKLAWELMEDGASPTTVALTAGISRSAVYIQAQRYAEHMAERGLSPVVERDRDPWTIAADGEEFIVSHPDLGVHRALFEDEDGSLTIWKEGGVYRPINREHPDRSEGDWTEEHELLYAPLVAFRGGVDQPDETYEERHEAIAEHDALSFLDTEEDEDAEELR